MDDTLSSLKATDGATEQLRSVASNVHEFVASYNWSTSSSEEKPGDSWA
jgi:hypothetical protein